MTTDPGSEQPAAALTEVKAVGGGLLFGDDPMDVSDLLNTVLHRGAVVHGEVTMAVADADLIKLNLGLLLQAVATAELRSRGREGGARRPDPFPEPLAPFRDLARLFLGQSVPLPSRLPMRLAKESMAAVRGRDRRRRAAQFLAVTAKGIREARTPRSKGR